jgi:signal transduction histidine kinase/CheY-like chemotaxis protein
MDLYNRSNVVAATSAGAWSLAPRRAALVNVPSGAAALLRAIEALTASAGGGAEAGREASAAAQRLIERCAAHEAVVEGVGERLEEMLAVVTAMTAFDYAKRVRLREDDDWIVNALAIGLNMLGEELARATEELTTARDRALAANRAKSSFLANMSHELRTPLNAIIGYSELIREELEGGEYGDAAEDLGKISVAAHHLLNLIKETLDLSKIEAGRMELAIEEVALRELLEAIVSTITPMVTARGNRLILDESRAPASIMTDRLKLQQILYNLLSNATKFTSHGTIRVVAATITVEGAPWLSLCVEDSGIGIATEKLPLIFGAFTQADEYTSASYGGTGLGLTICRHFAEMMGGDLTVESALGEGSRFTVRLPQAGGDGRGRREAAALPSNAIVMADRDPRAHDLVRRVVARHGLAVLSATTHFEVLNLVAVVRPALVILDLGAPGVDGWSLLAALRSGDRPVPVVVSSEREQRARALALGAADLLSRPLEGRRVAEVVLRFREGLRLGCVALIATDPRWHARLRFLLEDAGWRVATGSEARVDAVVIDARGAAPGSVEEASAALPWASAPALVLRGAEALGPLSRPHVAIDLIDLPFEDALAVLSQMVLRYAAEV